MVNKNSYPGLPKGPIDAGDRGSLISNEIAGGAIKMGAVVKLNTTIASDVLLPSVLEPVAGDQGKRIAYGIVVDGQNDGIYGDGTAGTDVNKAALASGESVAVLKAGRCPALVTGAVLVIGDALSISATPGYLEKTAAADFVVAFALQPKVVNSTDIMAVEFARDGIIV